MPPRDRRISPACKESVQFRTNAVLPLLGEPLLYQFGVGGTVFNQENGHGFLLMLGFVSSRWGILDR